MATCASAVLLRSTHEKTRFSACVRRRPKANAPFVRRAAASSCVALPWAPNRHDDFQRHPGRFFLKMGRLQKWGDSKHGETIPPAPHFSKILKNKISRPLVFSFYFRNIYIFTVAMAYKTDRVTDVSRRHMSPSSTFLCRARRHVLPGNVRNSVRFIRRRDSENVDLLKTKKKKTRGREILCLRIFENSIFEETSKNHKFSKFSAAPN